MSKASKFPKRGEIWLIKCDKIKEFSKDYRPVLIISGDIQNEFDKLIVVVPLTTDDIDNIQPFEILVDNTPETGLNEVSKIIFNHPFTVFKELRLINKLGKVSRKVIEEAKKVWKIVFDIENW